MAKNRTTHGAAKVIRSQADVDKAVKAINNILRRDKERGIRMFSLDFRFCGNGIFF